MDEEKFKHLTNLLRHSTVVTFKIPSIFFKEKSHNTEHFQKQKQEVADAWIYLQRDFGLTLSKIKEDDEIITVNVKVKQPKVE